ncbi:uncharacterized protein LOC142573968 [Dermacentor variabilis]|uniref:uncharacterized protein LOC142573968 n=1 Tax=Dermacentor variabilis TaxID=34621 RepID=UPI003F5C9607
MLKTRSKVSTALEDRPFEEDGAALAASTTGAGGSLRDHCAWARRMTLPPPLPPRPSASHWHNFVKARARPQVSWMVSFAVNATWGRSAVVRLMMIVAAFSRGCVASACM